MKPQTVINNVIFVTLLLVAFSAVGQESFEVSLDSTVDNSCTRPPSINPKIIQLSKGYWRVTAKSGAWNPFGNAFIRYQHSFRIDLADGRRYGSSSGVQLTIADAVKKASANNGKGLFFYIQSDQAAQIYIPDTLCTDNIGSEVVNFNKIPAIKDSCNTTSKPCQISTGAKFRNESDFSNASLSFQRNYHSYNLSDIGFGKGWHNQFFKYLSSLDNSLVLIDQLGRGEPWRKENGIWVGDADSDYLITETASSFTVILKRGDVHEYDLDGRLLSETDTQGKVTSYEYDTENRLVKVSNHYQQSLTFTYSNDGKNHVVKVTDALGAESGYEYVVNYNLPAVVYPDGDNDQSNNPKRLYHYEDANFPNHITGITNANGERYATFAYDTNGKAIESALAPTTNPVGQQRVQLNYQGAN